jgi:2-polyprenyl-6-methoxyphenol hydroxylase-like FAD-dependent oxidoreductase
MLVERNPSTTCHPKMDITNARSMELFRRLALADQLRAVAVPESSNFDVSWITSLSGHELHRFRYPSVTEWRRLIRATNDGNMPGEPPMQVSQVEIEPVLQCSIKAEPRVEARWGIAFDDLSQDAEGVTVKLRATDGQTEQVRCSYVIGCDGGQSRVRSCLGIQLDGQSRVMQRFMTHFRSRAMNVLQRWGVAWHYQSAAGTMIAQNDHDTWTLGQLRCLPQPEQLQGLRARTEQGREWMMTQNDPVVVGIDVAKDKVDACIRSLSLGLICPSSAQGRRKLIGWLRKHKVTKAVMEGERRL